jgi:hypothetical protein
MTAAAPVSRGLAVPRRARTDLVVIVALFAIAAAAGTQYVRTIYASGWKPWFYQVDFGPAVMQACGRGFVTPDARRIAPLAAFLDNRVDRFSCADLPADAPRLGGSGGPQPQLTWAYLMRSVAVVWRVTGISWSGLAPLSGVAFGATVALSYALFRRVAAVPLALAGAVMVMTSPLYLTELPNLRDYSKVPFLLALGLVLSMLMSRNIRPGRLLALTAAYGAILGIAIGFRNDPLITVPPFVLLVLLSSLEQSRSSSARSKVVALLVAAVAFAVTSSQVLAAYRGGGGANMQHAAIVGLMRPFDDALEVTNGSTYDIGSIPSDSYAAALVGGFASRTRGRLTPIQVYSAEYDAAATQYLKAIARTLPADLLVRAYAAVLKIIELPSSAAEVAPLPYVTASWVTGFYALRSAIMMAVRWLWIVAIVVAVALVSRRDLRLAVLLGLLFVYCAAYPAIQYHDRHVFHLSLIPIAALAFVAQTAIDALARIRSRRAAVPPPAGDPPGITTRRQTAQVVMLFAGAAVLAAGPLMAARWYQQRRLVALIDSYLQAPREAVTTTQRDLPDGRSALDMRLPDAESSARATPGSVRTEYLIVELGGGACDSRKLDVTIRYEGSHPFADFSRSVTVSPPLDPGKTALVTSAAYFYFQRDHVADPDVVWYRFQGLEVSRAGIPCVTGVYRLRDPARFALLLETDLPPGWIRSELYRTVARWERRVPRSEPVIATSPDDLRFTRQLLATPIAPLPESAITQHVRAVTMQGPGQFTVDGSGGGRFGYLMEARPAHFQRGARFLAEGTLYTGGLTIGLVRGGEWARQAHVVSAGSFIVVVEVPADGEYSLIVANNLPQSARTNHFVVERAGWIQ